MKKLPKTFAIKSLSINTDIQVVDKDIETTETFIIALVTYKDGSRSLHRYNNCFESYKLVGILEYIKNEIIEMINKPTKYELVEQKGNDKKGNKFEVIKK